MEKNQIMEELGSDMPLRDGSSLVFFLPVASPSPRFSYQLSREKRVSYFAISGASELVQFLIANFLIFQHFPVPILEQAP